MFDRHTERSGSSSLKWDKYKGKDVLPMWVADMDFRSPEPVIQALQERADHGVFGYTLPDKELVDTVVRYLKTQHGFCIEPNWLVWLPGLVPALNLTCRAFPGDVATFTPVYPPFLTAPDYAGCTCHCSSLVPSGNHWAINWEDLEAGITDETTILMLCNPHNPVGKVFSRNELERLGDIAQRNDLIICSDEIHCDLILEPDQKHIPTATISPEVAARTIALYAPSKTYNLPGLSCAFAVIPNTRVRHTFKQTIRGIITEVNAFGFAGCRAAYQFGEPWRQDLITQLRANRDFLYRFIETHCPEIKLLPMEATYLAWIDVTALKLDDPVKWFEDHGLGLSDGKFFGQPGYVRINFGCPFDTLKAGCDRLSRGVQAARSLL